MSQLPWQPLYTIERSEQPEVTVYGIISVVGGNSSSGRPDEILAYGDVNHILWSRSLLKPWQLLSHYEIVKDNFPKLKPKHLALMMASHSCEQIHLDLLADIIAIGRLEEDMLLCPASLPMSADMRTRFKASGQQPSSLFHNCSGKHLSYLLSLRAQHKATLDYVNLDNLEHRRLEAILAAELGRRADSFLVTTDGCQLPNYGLGARELATLYNHLSAADEDAQEAQNDDAEDQQTSFAALQQRHAGSGDTAESALQYRGELKSLMRQYPEVIGGSDRFDTKLMQGRFAKAKQLQLIAKDGADGLLAVGVLPTEKYPDGLGILIKVSSGYEIRHMEAILGELLRQLDLYEVKPMLTIVSNDKAAVKTDHIKTYFHFQITQNARSGALST
jgi:L-asparaginase II